LDDLRRIQELQGSGPPFIRLAKFLSCCSFLAAGIDAPFSVPAAYVPSGSYARLLDLVSSIHFPDNRPFPSASDFVNAVAGKLPPLNPPKPLRITEKYWQNKGLNVRSTLWAGPRGGAPITDTCLTLLQKSNCPIWPWNMSREAGMLVEAFPMAQLNNWGLPFIKYNGPGEEALRNRENIISQLPHIDLGNFEAILRENADALDAVICAFAAIAAVTDNMAVNPEPEAFSEGWIAVHAQKKLAGKGGGTRPAS
jgi:hypothetical protein